MAEITSSDFASFLYQKAYEDIPSKVIEQAKMCLIDYLSCAYLGEYTMRKFNENYLNQYGSSASGNSIVVGSGIKTSVDIAGMLNGMNSHVSELDDGHRYAFMHLSAPVISALLSVSDGKNMSGQDFLRGTVIGYETAIRLSMAVQPGHKQRGFHTTGTCGAVGVAAAVAAALKYSKEEFTDAVNAALTDAGGILAAIDHGSKLKPYNIGRAVCSGIHSAFAAKAGLHSCEDLFHGNRGFFHAYTDTVNEEKLTEWDGQYKIETIYRKPYAACRHAHPAIECALIIQKQHMLEPEKIESILIETYDLAVKGHDQTSVVNSSEAKMSIPYGVAAAIVLGNADYQSYFDEAVENPVIKDLMKKVVIHGDSDLSKLVPAKRAAIVTIHCDNEQYSQRVDYPKGEPENPITREELEQKLYSLGTASGKAKEDLQAVLRSVWNIENDYVSLQNLLSK